MAILSTNLIHGEKPRFGDPKHIAFCKEVTQIEEKREQVRQGGAISVELDTAPSVIIVDVRLDCPVCSTDLIRQFELQSDADIEGKEIKCHKCRSTFEFIDEDQIEITC